MMVVLFLAFFCLALSTNEVGTKFLEENKNKPGVVTLPSGLQYKVITKGTGSVHPTPSTKVLCHYEGTLVDGTVFDSSYTRGEPITFAPKQVIKGWTEAMQLMVEGDKWELYIPADLAYGRRGSPPVIPEDSALIFKIEILQVPGEKKEKAVPTSEPTAATTNRTEESGGLPITTIAGIAVGFLLLAYLWTTKYTFKAQTSDLEKLFKEVAVLNLPIEKKIEVLKERLSEAYPGRIYPEPEWFLNYAGGILCAIQVLYVSNWEYILIWGTPSGNEGLTGRHPFCQFHDTTLDGEVLYWSEKAPLRTQVFKTGDQWVHVFGDSGGQRIDGAGWAVEYCHGPMMSILPFGLVSVFCNSLDFWSYIKTLKIYALTMIYCNYLPNSFKTLPTKSASSSPSNSKKNKQKTK